MKAKKLDTRAIIPTRAHSDDLGFDLYAIERVVVPGGGSIKARTGIAIEFPPGWGGFIKPRSSQGSKTMDVYGGVVDGGYRGELLVLLYNGNADELECDMIWNDEMEGSMPVRLIPDTIIYEAGEKIGQLVPIQIYPHDIIEVQDFSDETSRGDKGFGSTGA